MLRRITSFVALATGMIPAAYALRHYADAQRHALLILGIVAVGVVLNFTVLLGLSFALRPAIRNLAAIVMTLVGISIAAAAWQHRQIALEPPSPVMAQAGGEDVESSRVRGMSARLATNLAWAATATAYLIVAILLIPSPSAPRHVELTPALPD